MFFLNPWLLIGLAGVSIPLLIHLVRQQAAKPVEWGAMRFLFDTISVRRRKMEWEDLVLMAARCLLVSLIALAVARPFVSPDSAVPWLFVLPAALLGIAMFGGSFVLGSRKVRWTIRMISLLVLLLAAGLVLFERYLNLKRFEATGRRDVALVIDASTSMQLRREGGTGFELAIGEAKRLVNESPRGTAFTVVLGGPAPQAVTAAPLTHRADVIGVLNGLASVGGSFRAHEALGMATLALFEGTSASKEIVVFTDSQRGGWRLDNPGAWRNLEAAWQSLPNRPKLLLRSLGTPANFRNIALNDLQLSRAVVGTDREVVIRALVQNTGAQAVTPGPVALEVDGTKVGEEPVGLLVPGQSETVEFRHRFEQAGPKLVQLRVDAKDDLEEDGCLDHVVNVRSTLPVLLVEGNPSGSFFERASGYSALALAPSQAVLTGKSPGASFLMNPSVVNASALTTADLQGAEVIILADVPRLPPNIATALSARVAAGAGLITIAGPRAEPGFYNAWEGADGPVVPMLLGGEAVAEEGVSPATSTFNHEALKIFSEGGDLQNALITRWRETSHHAGMATQAAALSNGDAFLAARNYGNGRTMLVTSALDARGGGLPARRSFVPLVHELTSWVAGRGADLNVMALWSPSISLSSGGAGLLGQYRKGRDFDGDARERVDPVVDFEWKNLAPMRDIPKDHFTVRWTGRLRAPAAGEYHIDAEVDDEVFVKIGTFPEMHASLGSQRLGSMKLEAGQTMPIEVRFSEQSGEARIRLFWTPPGGGRQIIPASAFAPPSTEVSEEFRVTDPRGEIRSASLRSGGGGQELVVEGAAVPGVYLVSANGFLKEMFPDMSGGGLPLVVLRDASESSFEEMSEDDYGMIRSAIDLVLPTSVADILAVMDGKGFGREIWKLLAVAALVLFIMESMLARWVSCSRRTAEDVRVEFGEETAWRGGFR